MLRTDQAHDKQMELRQFIRTDITASAIAHLSVLALIFLFTEVHPFGLVTAEPIAVDIVTPDEVPAKEPAKEPDPVPPPPAQTPSPDASSQAKSEAANAPQPSKPQPAAQPPASARRQQQAALSPPRSGRKEVAAAPPQPQAQLQSQPSLPAPSQPPPPAQAAASVPAYTPPQPDLTLKYHVMLGLPEDLPLPSKPASSGDKPGDGIDATASSTADITSSVVAEFRRHLKMCSKLPDSVAASDNVIIKLRVLMRPDGRLAREPILIEASASAKGPLLMQSAISALQACQPYAMLPAERYGEWKVLDLSFSPQDFNS
jgi:outer membrane biosynthesis protein TonB